MDFIEFTWKCLLLFFIVANGTLKSKSIMWCEDFPACKSKRIPCANINFQFACDFRSESYIFPSEKVVCWAVSKNQSNKIFRKATYGNVAVKNIICLPISSLRTNQKMTNAPAATGSIPKPILKGLHNATIKRNLVVSMVLVTVVTAAYKVFINDPKKKDYAEFYKNYDANKAFEKMKAAGRFQSCS